jgi:hypothetical protein
MECYICYDKESSSDKFVKDPCKCKGSNKIHTSCLKKLIEKNGSTCSICKQTFTLNTPKVYDSYQSLDLFESLNESNDSNKSKSSMKYTPIQRREDYTFREDNQNYVYEDKNNIINYTYLGDGTYRVDYQHKRCCIIS